jgi:hypothetical protein
MQEPLQRPSSDERRRCFFSLRSTTGVEAAFGVEQSGDKLFRKLLADFDRIRFSMRIEPPSYPVDSAEDDKRSQFRIGAPEVARSNSVGDDAANAAVEPIAFGNHRLSSSRRQGPHVHGQGRPPQFVDDHVHKRDDDSSQFFRRRIGAFSNLPERREQHGEGIIMSGK